MFRVLRHLSVLLVSGMLLLPSAAAQAATLHASPGAPAQQSTIDPNSLQLPAADFSPIPVKDSQALTNPAAAADAIDLYDTYHTQSYAQLGVVAGYDEVGFVTTSDDAHLSYVAAVFPSPDAAKAAVEDARTYFTKAGASSFISACPADA